MSRKRTLGLSGLVALMLAAPAVARDDVARLFANCAGRLSAEVEHGWLTQHRDIDRIERQRDAVLALLESVTDPARERNVMRHRIDAKVAHAGLLRQAYFGEDDELAGWAEERADFELRQCRHLLLDG